MLDKNNKLTKLKERQAQLQAQIQRLEAAEKSREKKRDTRRKILVGSYYLDKLKNDKHAMKELIQSLDTFLTRDNDRLLFNLPTENIKKKGFSDEPVTT